MARDIYIQHANYITDHIVELYFNDGKVKRIDFSSFLQKHPHPQYNKYLNPINFKKFYIDHGNIVWGKNWDLMFPIEKLYLGKI